MAGVEMAAHSFSQLAGGLTTPVSIVTVALDGERSGCLVGFETQASIHPPRYLACLSRRNHTYHVVVRHRAAVLAVHFLSDSQRELAELFGSRTGDEIDKFERCAWHTGPRGAAILDDCENWFVGGVIGQLALGDHVGFLLDPIAAHHGGARQPLTLRDVRGMVPGHAP
jgi:flavin reductase (DIM6/NTAB) family NADH-FMN oxidoreductase RutF